MDTTLLGPVETTIVLGVVANGIVEGLVKPLFERFKWDKMWLMYVSWAVAALLVIAAQANVFMGIFPGPWGHWIGVIVSSLAAGRGANFMHDVVKLLKPGRILLE